MNRQKLVLLVVVLYLTAESTVSLDPKIWVHRYVGFSRAQQARYDCQVDGHWYLNFTVPWHHGWVSFHNTAVFILEGDSPHLTPYIGCTSVEYLSGADWVKCYIDKRLILLNSRFEHINKNIEYSY